MGTKLEELSDRQRHAWDFSGSDRRQSRRETDSIRIASSDLRSRNEGMMSFTKEGIPLPAIGRPSVLYRHLFSLATDTVRMDYLLRSGGSVLDLALEEARSLQRSVNARDAKKLDEYFASVRDVEKKLQKNEIG